MPTNRPKTVIGPVRPLNPRLEQIAVDRIAVGDPITFVNLLYTSDGDRIHRMDRTRIAGSIHPDPV